MNIGFAVDYATKILREKFIQTSSLDSEILMAKVLNKDRKYIIYSNQGVVLTDLGITGESNCHGIQEFDKGKSIEANVMCNYRERNGDTAYLHFKNIEGEEDVRTNGFTIISGTGRWQFLIGQKCIGAIARISDFKEGTKNAAFEWKGKCNIPDDKYFKFI